MACEEDTLYTNLPIEERCLHKSWKARISGYEEIIKLYGQLDEKATEWNKFIGIIKNFVIDSNAIAQEKGLEATLLFVKSSAVAGRTVEDVMSGLITKCYGAPKAKTKDIAIQITLMFIEIEKHDIVMEELVKGMDHKFPKIVSTCIKAAILAIKEFGSKVLNIKPLLKKLPLLLEDRDKSVRDEAKLLIVEIYSWIGLTPVKASLKNIKPLQIQELEVEFEKVSNDKPRPTRFLRSKQEQIVKMEKLAGASDEVLEEETDKVEDPEEHIDPVNILCQLDETFYVKLESKKWQDRKEAINMLEGVLSTATKLENGDYGDLVKILKKIITKDTNILVISIAAKCMTMLANGLKKRFEPYVSACIPTLFEKFKEKKQNVVKPLRDTVDAIYLTTTLDSIYEDILTAINNKNPSVKAESISFLARCFTKCTPTILNKKYLKIFTTTLIKTLNESDSIVRDNSAEALGTAWKVVSEKNIINFLSSIDAIKLSKIKDAAEKAIITARPTTVLKKPIYEQSCILSNDVEKKIMAPNNKNTTVQEKSSTTCKTGGRKALPLKSIPISEIVKEIDDNELENLALTFCSPEILNGMTDANWKTRLSSIQQFSQIIYQMEFPSINSQVLIKLLNIKPGLKDNNTQVQKLKLECLKKIFEKFPVTRMTMECCVQDVCSLLGDSKNGIIASEVLTTLAESTTLDLVSNSVLEYAFNAQKNSKVQIDTLGWLSGAILEFGFIIEPKCVMQHVKKALAATNPQVRKAVISFLAIMYLYMGSQLRLYFENEKPTLVKLINVELQKHQGKIPPKPTRGKNIEKSTESLEVTNDKKTDQEIAPRVNITSQITDSLINELSDRDWKVRSNALIILQNKITNAKLITNELGEIREALQIRIGDSNSRIGTKAIHLVELIAKSMGSSFKNYIKGYLPGMLYALGDSKEYKRQSARQCMNTWVNVCGYREFFGGDILIQALLTMSVTTRLELLYWLAEHLPLIPSKIIPADELKCLLPCVYNCLEDKNSYVRCASDKTIVGFMIHLGYTYMYNYCEKLRPLSAKHCRYILDKERPNLPVVINEKPKVVKSCIVSSSIIKSKELKTSDAANKENIIPHNTSVAPGKKNEEADKKSLFQQNNLKHQRDIDEHKFKSLKWNFTSPREEYIEQLREQMFSAGVNKVLIENMFHSHFKNHIIAIDYLSEDLDNGNENILALICNLDLILKWMTLRFFDTNPTVLIRGLHYLQRVFDILLFQKYELHETEAASFVPYLLSKLGDSNGIVKNNVRAILRQAANIFPTKKLFQYLIDGVKTKNSRQRTECLDHLKILIENGGLSVCHPTVESACKQIAKSIGDRDHYVRTAALNWIVYALFLYGENLLNFLGNISDKDMSLLNERLKRVPKNRNIPIASVQPTIKSVKPPIQTDQENQVIETEDNIIDNERNSENEEYNNTYNVLQEQNHEQSSQMYLNDTPSSVVENEENQVLETEDVDIEHDSEDKKYNTTYNVLREPNHEQSSQMYLNDTSNRTVNISHGIDSIPTVPEHLSPLDIILSKSGDNRRMTRFALDEKFIKELEAEVIMKPKLVLQPINWTTNHDEISFGKIINKQSKLSSKPCLNVSPYNTATMIVHSKPLPATVDPIQQLIKQITSQNITISKAAQINLDKMLSSPDMRSTFIEDGKVLLIFHAIKEQFDILSVCHDNNIIGRYKNLLNLCLILFKHKEFMLKLNEQTLHDLLSNLLYLLSMNRPESSADYQQLGKCVNNLILSVLEQSTPTPVICALLVMLYNTVEHPEHFTDYYQELLMKCVWKIVKDFPKWADELSYNPVLIHIHKFMKTFDSKYWKKQQSDIPLRTYHTVLYTMTKVCNNKVLESLATQNFPKESQMVVYIYKVLKHLNC